jgi:hypothetical protein
MRTDGKQKLANTITSLANLPCNALKTLVLETAMARPRGVEPLFSE